MDPNLSCRSLPCTAQSFSAAKVELDFGIWAPALAVSSTFQLDLSLLQYFISLKIVSFLDTNNKTLLLCIHC